MTVKIWTVARWRVLCLAADVLQNYATVVLPPPSAALTDANRACSVRFDFATTDSLRKLLDHGCEVIHFVGHAGLDPFDYVCFENGRGGADLLSVDALQRLLSSFDGLHVQLVFIASCHSLRIGEVFIATGVRHVVCVKREAKVMDRASILFARAFYHSLLTGHSVTEAFTAAKGRVGCDGTRVALPPVPALRVAS